MKLFGLIACALSVTSSVGVSGVASVPGNSITGESTFKALEKAFNEAMIQYPKFEKLATAIGNVIGVDPKNAFGNGAAMVGRLVGGVSSFGKAVDTNQALQDYSNKENCEVEVGFSKMLNTSLTVTSSFILGFSITTPNTNLMKIVFILRDMMIESVVAVYRHMRQIVGHLYTLLPLVLEIVDSNLIPLISNIEKIFENFSVLEWPSIRDGSRRMLIGEVSQEEVAHHWGNATGDIKRALGEISREHGKPTSRRQLDSAFVAHSSSVFENLLRLFTWLYDEKMIQFNGKTIQLLKNFEESKLRLSKGGLKKLFDGFISMMETYSANTEFFLKEVIPGLKGCRDVMLGIENGSRRALESTDYHAMGIKFIDFAAESIATLLEYVAKYSEGYISFFVELISGLLDLFPDTFGEPGKAILQLLQEIFQEQIEPLLINIRKVLDPFKNSLKDISGIFTAGHRIGQLGIEMVGQIGPMLAE